MSSGAEGCEAAVFDVCDAVFEDCSDSRIGWEDYNDADLGEAIFQDLPEAVVASEDELASDGDVGQSGDLPEFADFTGGLDLPPLHHIISGATESLSQAMPHYDVVIPRFR
eukprot:10371599-Karenia_brevis.AAC.1